MINQTIKAIQARITPAKKMTVDYRGAQPADRMAKAMEAMRDVEFLHSRKHQEQHWRANRVGAHPQILEFSDKLIKRARGLGIPLFAHTIVRSEQDQAQMYLKGVSRDTPADGQWPHRFAAVDIIHGTQGYMDGLHSIPFGWDVLGHLGKQVAHSMNVQMTWGGDWKFYDPAHWELANWKEIVWP
jgi:hypothetical protein